MAITKVTNSVLSSGANLDMLTGKSFLHEENMASNSATGIASQQSIKAYVDSQVTAQDLDFQGDSGGALSIDLDSESLTITGGTGLDTVGSGNTITVNIDSTVTTLTGSQTLTNKTLTNPVISTIVSTSNGAINLDPNGSGVVVFKGNATKGAGQFKLNCENNSHGITIKGPPHSAGADYTLTLPNDDGNANQFLQTNGSGVLTWAAASGGGYSGGNFEITNADQENGVVLTLNNTFDGSGWANNDIGGAINFESSDAGVTQPIRAQIKTVTNNALGDPYPLYTDMVFSTTIANNSPSEAMRITYLGRVGIGTNSPTQQLDVNGTVELNNLTIAGAQGTDGQVLTSTGSGVAWEDASGGGSTTLLGLTDVGADGTSGQVLTTNGSGAFTFTTVSGGSYNDAAVDTHLNRSTASNGEVLSWNGSDYDWVAQSGGGGGGSSYLSGGTSIYLHNSWAPQNIGRNVVTKLNYDTVIFGNAGTPFSTTNNNYTAPSAGKYLFLGQVNSANFVTGSNAQQPLYVYIYKNGSSLQYDEVYNKSQSTDTIRYKSMFNYVIDLAQNDVIDFRARLSNFTSTATLDIDRGEQKTFMYIVRIE